MKIDLSSIMEMIAEQDGETIENKNPPVIESKLQIEQLFKLFEEIEPTIKERGATQTSFTREPSTSEEEESKGIEVSPKQILEFIVPEVVYREKNIAQNKHVIDSLVKEYLTGGTVTERLRRLSYISATTSGTVKKSATTEIPYLVKKLAVIDGILAVFKSFEASTAGFVTEQVVASLFGTEAQRKPTKSTTDDGYVTDVEINGKQYGIKTVASGTERLMSSYNFVRTISEHGSITLLDCEKIIGKGGDVEGFLVLEEEVTPNSTSLAIKPTGNDFIRLKGPNKGISNVKELFEAYKSPGLYEVVVPERPDEPIPLDFLMKKKASEKEKKKGVRGFTSYKIRHIPSKKREEILFKHTSDVIRKHLLELTSQVMKAIKELKESLEEVAKGMSEFFVADDRISKRNEIISAAEKVQPSAEAATKMEE